MTKILLPSIALLFSAGTMMAQTSHLNAKTGLWQNTVVSHMKGTLPLSDDELARLTPEQRERIESAYQANVASAAQPHVTKSCVTAEKLKKGFDLGDEKDPNCKRSVLEQTSTTTKLHEVCTDEKGSTTEDFDIHILGTTNMEGTGHIAINRGGRTMTSDISITGKWISSDCGDIK